MAEPQSEFKSTLGNINETTSQNLQSKHEIQCSSNHVHPSDLTTKETGTHKAGKEVCKQLGLDRKKVISRVTNKLLSSFYFGFAVSNMPWKKRAFLGY